MIGSGGWSTLVQSCWIDSAPPVGPFSCHAPYLPYRDTGHTRGTKTPPAMNRVYPKPITHLTTHPPITSRVVCGFCYLLVLDGRKLHRRDPDRTGEPMAFTSNPRGYAIYRDYTIGPMEWIIDSNRSESPSNRTWHLHGTDNPLLFSRWMTTAT